MTLVQHSCTGEIEWVDSDKLLDWPTRSGWGGGSMRIALDYDGTYTLDPDFWDAVIALAKGRGHSVWVVTCRRDTEENREDVKVDGCHTVFTNLAAKRRVCEERGLKIDVWVDDDVECIWRGK